MIGVKLFPGRGRGIVAQQFIVKGALIETAPVCSFSPEQWSAIDKTDLFKYCFVRPSEYSSNKTVEGYIIFGLSSLCNHSKNPNAYIEWKRDEIGLWAHLIALQDIPSQAEVFLFYTNISDYPTAHEFT